MGPCLRRGDGSELRKEVHRLELRQHRFAQQGAVAAGGVALVAQQGAELADLARAAARPSAGVPSARKWT
jgi:hypothetical protein